MPFTASQASTVAPPGIFNIDRQRHAAHRAGDSGRLHNIRSAADCSELGSVTNGRLVRQRDALNLAAKRGLRAHFRGPADISLSVGNNSGKSCICAERRWTGGAVPHSVLPQVNPPFWPFSSTSRRRRDESPNSHAADIETTARPAKPSGDYLLSRRFSNHCHRRCSCLSAPLTGADRVILRLNGNRELQ